jgi:phasin family protein
MTTPTVEQILAANKAAVSEAQSVAATALTGFEKLVELNLAAAKAVLSETSGDFLSVLSAKTPADALATQAALVKPLAEKSVSYGRAVYAIVSETSAELTKAAEDKLAEGQKTFTAAVDSLAKNAPAGSESVFAVVKAATAASHNAIESAKASAKKALETAEKQAATLADSALNAVKTPAGKK